MPTGLRIDPKTRRLIVSDLTPSVKGEIVTLQQYADFIAVTLIDSNTKLEAQRRILDGIWQCLSSMSGLNNYKEEK